MKVISGIKLAVVRNITEAVSSAQLLKRGN